jgi:NAD(P)H-hydrate epimerase
MISQDDVILPKRYKNTHKGDYGKLLIVAGSKDMTGAAALCAMSAIKTGCGIVKLAVPKAIQGIMQSSLKEIITYGLDDKDGAFYLGSVGEVLKLANTVDAVAIGPGLTNSSNVKEFVKEVILKLEKPLVLDADALNAISDSVDMIIGKDVILTPHMGEMSRLLGVSVDDINNNIYATVEKFISKYKATLVLKSSRTVIGNDTEGIYINCTGNPGMATAGSGDVLTGMISSFLVQGLKGVKAAIYGVYYHGKAGDMASEKYGEYGLTATNILEYIPYAMKM